LPSGLFANPYGKYVSRMTTDMLRVFFMGQSSPSFLVRNLSPSMTYHRVLERVTRLLPWLSPAYIPYAPWCFTKWPSTIYTEVVGYASNSLETIVTTPLSKLHSLYNSSLENHATNPNSNQYKLTKIVFDILPVTDVSNLLP